jgi:hypothetical protein
MDDRQAFLGFFVGPVDPPDIDAPPVHRYFAFPQFTVPHCQRSKDNLVAEFDEANVPAYRIKPPPDYSDCALWRAIQPGA